MPDTREHSRREVLESLGIGTAGLLLGGYTATARGFARNETLNIGVIGCGGRARGRLMPALKKFPGVNFVALCDVYDAHRDAAAFVAAGNGKKDKQLFTTRYHEELLDRKDVDAVIVATPDHWHVPITIDACAAGKDVYVEKPLTHKLDEGQAVIDAQNRHNRVVQVGAQQRSMPQFHIARKIVAEGKLGDIHKIHMSWNRGSPNVGNRRTPNIPQEQVDWKRFLGNAPDQPYDALRMRSWRWMWDFGGGILTDLMVHWMDAVNFVLDLPMPASATTIGHHFATEGVWETPDTIQTLLSYPDRRMQLHFEGTFVNSYGRAGMTIMGTHGTIYADRGRIEFHPEERSEDKPFEQILGEGPRGADFFDVPDGEAVHLNDWLEAVRARRKAGCPAEAGVLAAAAAHLGNKAYRTGQVAGV